MMESNPPEKQNQSSDQTAENPYAVPAAEREKSRIRNSIVVAVAMLVIAGTAQVFAPLYDHQNANLIALACLAIATLYALISWHRYHQLDGRPWHVPGLTAAAGTLLAISFEFGGFNGEMLPQFHWRFGNRIEHELKSVPAEVDQTGVDGSVSEPPPSQSAGDGESLQFLGPQRNAVYPVRSFAVPKNESEVTVLWDHGIGEGWSSFAVADDQAITLEQRGDLECLTCYRLSDGELIWMLQHPGRHENPLGGIGPRSTPTIQGEKVYATSATGFLWCVNRLTGTVIWTQEILNLAGWDNTAYETAAPWGYACSPLVVDGLCVITLGGPGGEDSVRSLAALDADNGELKWKSGNDQLSYASPILTTLDGERQIVSVNEKTVSGHDIQTGKRWWSFEWPGSTNTGANCSSAVTVGENQILVGKGYGGGSALVNITQDDSAWTTRDQWRSSRVLKTKFNHTCVAGSVGYAISNGSLQAVNLIDATEYWTQPRRSRAGQGQVVLVDDVLIVQDEQGEVAFVQASSDDYHELFRFPALNSKTWNVPTIAGRYLIVRNDRQVICFRLPPQSTDR